LAFRWLGDRVRLYYAISLAAQILLILLVCFIARQLGATITGTFLAGMGMALWPTLSELYFWPTMILSATALALPLYIGSAAAWVVYVQGRRVRWLAASLVCYALGVFSYEIGLFLPLAYTCTPDSGSMRRNIGPAVAFLGVVLLYAVWRLTDAFGLGSTYLPPHMQGGPTLAGWIWSTKEFGRWWIGRYMAASVVNGWYGFAALPTARQLVLLAGNVSVAVMAAGALFHTRRTSAEAPGLSRPLAIWGFFWGLASFLPLALSYSAGRLMYLPACGLAWLAAATAHRCHQRALILSLMVATVALLCANQGTSRQWQESGQVQRRLFKHVVETRAQWRDKEIVLFETHTTPPPVPQGASAPFALPFHYGNAAFLRGFTPLAMLDLAGRNGIRPRSILDAEHGPAVHDGQLVWHGRYDPDSTHTTPLNQVFVINVGAFLSRAAR
jgi:hypothetical protein